MNKENESKRCLNILRRYFSIPQIVDFIIKMKGSSEIKKICVLIFDKDAVAPFYI